jgi:hypothetical protein
MSSGADLKINLGSLPASGVPQPSPRAVNVQTVGMSPDGPGAIALNMRPLTSQQLVAAKIAMQQQQQQTNILMFWWRNRMCSSTDRVERHYAFLIALLIASTILFALLKTNGPVFFWSAREDTRQYALRDCALGPHGFPLLPMLC